MAVITKDQIPASVSLPREAHPCEGLPGDVVVQGLMLSDRMRVLSPQCDGKRASHLLAASVVDADGDPVFTVDQWEAHGGKHSKSVLNLVGVAMRLSGMNLEAEEKN